MLKRVIVLLAAMLGLGWIGVVAAQSYPTRPITMIVPFPAGGATDTLARYLAEQMHAILGQSIIIENVTGAAGSRAESGSVHKREYMALLRRYMPVKRVEIDLLHRRATATFDHLEPPFQRRGEA